jgi:isocitrate dehydrogenase
LAANSLTRPASRLLAARRTPFESFAPAAATSLAVQAGQVRRMATGIKKIKVKNPVVELDGDEMTRIIWQEIKNKVCILDVQLKT